MNGFQNTLDIKQQTKTATAFVLPAASNTTPPRYKRGTSPAADMQTLGGARITLSRNALPAIFTDKENSTFLAAILKCKDADCLKKLCDERTKVESSRLQNYETYMLITGVKPYNLQDRRRSYMTRQERQKFDELREKRNALLITDNATCYTPGWLPRWAEFRRLSQQLYTLTGHHGYNYGDNS